MRSQSRDWLDSWGGIKYAVVTIQLRNLNAINAQTFVRHKLKWNWRSIDGSLVQLKAILDQLEVNLRNSQRCFQVAPPLDRRSYKYSCRYISISNWYRVCLFSRTAKLPRNGEFENWRIRETPRTSQMSAHHFRPMLRSKRRNKPWGTGQPSDSYHLPFPLFEKHANWSWLRPPWGHKYVYTYIYICMRRICGSQCVYVCMCAYYSINSNPPAAAI